MRIGILTFHRAYNCGAMLQAWALKTVLERMGHTVEFPACNSVGYNPPRFMCLSIPADKKGVMWFRSLVGRLWLDLCGQRAGEKRGRAYDSFRKKYLPERNCEPSEFARHYDLMVVGSDQVFNSSIAEEWLPLFYGETFSSNLPKIVYAGSIGDDPKSGVDLDEFRKALRGFKAVSFREPFEDYPVVVDPTLLMSAADYGMLRRRWIGFSRRRYVYLYSVPATDFEIDTARKIARSLECALVVSPAYPDERTSRLPESASSLSPERMVQYIRGAEYVLAGSFHGTVFAIIHRKRFLTLRNRIDEPLSRPAALLAQLGLSERCVNPSVPVSDMVGRLVRDLPDESYGKLEELKKRSVDWLSGVLSAVGEKMNHA